MKKQFSEKGAISMFLVIILVPCIAFTSMFVDLSRVKLAQGMTTSAADLALNSLMANYDKDLSEYYGLMGSCQNIEEFYEVAAQCFLDSLYSQGLSPDEAESLMTQVARYFDADEVHDLFQLEVETETKDIISAFKGTNAEEASLGTSSTIIKDQMVEFMKYRAPVKITTRLIDRLKNMNVEKTLKEAKEDETLVEDKQAYAEAEETFMTSAYETYKQHLKYEKKGITLDSIKTMLADMKAARETYREVTKLIVSNFHNTSGLKKFERVAYPIDKYNYTEAHKHVYSHQDTDESGNTIYVIEQKKIDDLLENLRKAIEDFKKKRDAVATAVGDELINADIGNKSNQYNPIQWWVKVNNLISSANSDLDKAALKMLECYSKVLAIKKCVYADDVTDEWEKLFNEYTQSVKDLQENFLVVGEVGKGDNKKNKYLILVNKLEKYSKENIDNIDPSKKTLANGKTVNAAITEVDTKLSAHLKTLTDTISILDTLIDGNDDNIKSLITLADSAATYHSSFNTWSSNAQVQDTEMAKNDWASIEKIKKDAAENDEPDISDLTKQDILNFKTRMSNIRTGLTTIKTALTKMTFGGKELTEIPDFKTANDKVKKSVSTKLKNNDIATHAKEIFKDKFKPYSEAEAEVSSYKTDNPLLTENEPKFHSWMHKKFNKVTDDVIKQKQEEVDGAEKDATKKADEAKNKDRSTSLNFSKTNLIGNKSYAVADFPSGLKTDDSLKKFSLLDGVISGFTTLFTNLVNFKFDGIRDSLYSAEYVMDMFSYATYVNEGKYNLCLKTGKTAGDIEKDYATEYSNVTGNSENPDKGTWLSPKTFDTYNKTLTNKMINSTNNVLHGAEVEYILYGGKNSANVVSAFADIYLARYPMNLLSCFQHFWGLGTNTGRTINSIAGTISSATAGVVPIPVIKCVFILLLAAAETGVDLDRLQNGFQVEFYKGKDDWRISVPEGGSITTDTNKDATACEAGLFYSDYMYIFLYLGFQSDSAAQMYRRTADLVQVNMRKYTGKNDYKLKNARTYFQVNAKIRVKPLMLDLPINYEFGTNIKDATGWCTFEISDTRGYS